MIRAGITKRSQMHAIKTPNPPPMRPASFRVNIASILIATTFSRFLKLSPVCNAIFFQEELSCWS